MPRWLWLLFGRHTGVHADSGQPPAAGETGRAAGRARPWPVESPSPARLAEARRCLDLFEQHWRAAIIQDDTGDLAWLALQTHDAARTLDAALRAYEDAAADCPPGAETMTPACFVPGCPGCGRELCSVCGSCSNPRCPACRCGSDAVL